MKTHITHIVGISGSLRKGSFNTALLHAVSQFLPDGMTMSIVSVADLPLYNADLDLPAAKERPASIVQLRQELARAQGILFVSPEYNYSIPGSLKNAIDWASRGEDSPLLNKPVALMGATQGLWGTVRMQLAFLPVFQFMNMKVHYKPEVLVAEASKKFSQAGELTDTATKEVITKKLASFHQFILEQQASK